MGATQGSQESVQRGALSARGVHPLVLRLLVLLIVGAGVAGTTSWILAAQRLDAAVADALDSARSAGDQLVAAGVAEAALRGEEAALAGDDVAGALALVAAGSFESVTLRAEDGVVLASTPGADGGATEETVSLALTEQRARAAAEERADGTVVRTVVPVLQVEDAADGVVLETVTSLAAVRAADRTTAIASAVAVLVATMLALVPLTLIERKRDQRLREQRGTLAGMLAREARTFGEVNDLQRLKADFLTGVSHGLRTTLHVITGSAQTLSRRGEQLTPGQRKAVADRIAAQAQRFDSLVRDLLEVEELAEGRPATHRSDVLVSDVLHSVRFATDLEGRELASDVTGVSARMSPAHLERVLLHLVRNAVHHTPKGSRIVVVARRLADGAELIVEDDGPGIPAAERLQVFDPLSRGRGGHADPDPGLGLGLAVVRRVTHLYGGRAWIDDSPMGGAAVHVWIPDAAGSVGVDPFNLPATLDVGERQEPNQAR